MAAYPSGFRPRRGLNWFIIGLLYASFYVCRYDFRFATPGMVADFGFSTLESDAAGHAQTAANALKRRRARPLARKDPSAASSGGTRRSRALAGPQFQIGGS
jgi:hypothetical protein